MHRSFPALRAAVRIGGESFSAPALAYLSVSPFQENLASYSSIIAKNRFVGPAVTEEEDQISIGTRSFRNDSERKKIQEFIASNFEQKTVYIGWGSMIRKSTQGMVIFAVHCRSSNDQQQTGYRFWGCGHIEHGRTRRSHCRQ
mmetsp:Transcript_29654/g.43844  ORF Transcript_29654/g.43844 Transcript_29654/m.43844 type:complete len:143 (-) Transcript_29654:152-580(-)